MSDRRLEVKNGPPKGSSRRSASDLQDHRIRRGFPDAWGEAIVHYPAALYKQFNNYDASSREVLRPGRIRAWYLKRDRRVVGYSSATPNTPLRARVRVLINCIYSPAGST